MTGITRFLIGVVLLNVLLALAGIFYLVTIAGVQPQSCEPIWEKIENQMDGISCRGLGSNSACYGNAKLETHFRPFTEAPRFSAPGDIAALDRFQTISAAPLDLTRREYGVAVLSMEARVPGTMTGDLVTFILYGDSHLNEEMGEQPVANVAPGTAVLPAFYFYTGVGLTEQCLDLPEGDLPSGGILLQSPEGLAVAFTANGARIEIGSTILLQAQKAQTMTVTVLEGHASVHVPGYATQTAFGLQSIDIPLGGANGLQANGAPGSPRPAVIVDLAQSTVCRLIAWAGLKSVCTAGNLFVTRISPTAVPTVVPTLVPIATATLPLAPTAVPPLTNTACVVRPPVGWVTYVVQPGDTLFGLAQRTGTSMDALVAVNCIASADTIFVGQLLYMPFVPVPVTPSPVPPSPTPIAPTSTPLPPMMRVAFSMVGGATYTSDYGRYVAYADICNHGLVVVDFINQ
ncbi:MAG: LysM peptidoglycan-binding domain-containing protein, partial [Anaerolineae bacterium]|nr:LysM peptidoglycan-binding domain-containing protein [Anaerolineae bacterium]